MAYIGTHVKDTLRSAVKASWVACVMMIHSLMVDAFETAHSIEGLLMNA